MKKLFFLPVAFMFLLSGCDRQAEGVKPTKNASAETVLRSDICPTEAILLTETAKVNNMANCPFESCSETETFISYASSYHIYDDSKFGSTGRLTQTMVDDVLRDAKTVAAANKPAASTCSGSIITKYFFTNYYDQSGHAAGMNLTVSYYCCTTGGGGGID